MSRKNSVSSGIRMLLILVAILSPFIASAQRGESTFGLQTGYTSTNSSAIAGMFFQYGLSDHLRISPEMGLVVRNENLDAFTADLNFHCPLNVGDFDSGVQLYPLIGIDFSAWTQHKAIPYYEDVCKRISRFGLNLGGGFQFMPMKTLKLKLEVKYTLMEKYSTFVASIGCGYVF